MPVKNSLTDGAVALITSDFDLGQFISNNLLWLSVALIAVTIALFKGKRIVSAFEHALASNWQLVLLASTGIVLSLASGYTTFDGMRNFTNAPLLSVMITFGIQGVMLIVAWLIGESFATGMNHRPANGRGFGARDATIGMLLALALVGITFYWALQQFDAVTFTRAAAVEADWHRFADVTFYYALGLIVLAIIAFNFSRGGDLALPYVQSARVIARNLVLWVMFLATMTASVFFSFDSHFNAIFPQEQRARAAEIRTTSQIGAVVADIGALTQKRQIEEAESLFASEGWRAYDMQLAALAHAAQGAQAEIERYFVQQMEERRRAINQQQERIATAQSGQAGLVTKKVSQTEELSRLKAERPGLAAEYAEHKNELDAKAREIDAKRVEAMAEDRGVEGTLKQGKGPVYRERMAELATLRDQYKIKEERTNNAHKRLAAAETRIAQIERELSTIDGDLAQLKGEAETAQHRIRAAEAASADEAGQRLDPARVLPAFDRARAAFRQQPGSERLAALQQQCTHLVNAMSANPATKERVRPIDCDPKQAAEAAARVFALNAGMVAFQARCAGGDKLARHVTTDRLLAFGRQCLQDSGLISKDSADIGARLSAIDMNRDDKAHRFVVTWNAFLDGNRLAYLALVLAIAVDALVFMSGLFGAQALRSPLSDVPSPKARSARHLEAIIEAALLPDTFRKARMAREAIHPISGHDWPQGAGRPDGFTHEVRLGELDPESAIHVRDVLNAGATIGAVRDSDRYGCYFVRGELYEFLCDIIKREHKLRPEESKRYGEISELETRMLEALLPDVRGTADAVLRHLHPIDERNGFTSEIFMSEVEADHARAVRNVLTAGSSLRVVQRDKRDVDRYYLHADLYKTLARIRARALLIGGEARPQVVTGGSLQSANAAITDARSQRPRQLPARPELNGGGPQNRNGYAGQPEVHGHDPHDSANGSVALEEPGKRFLAEVMGALGLGPDSFYKIGAPDVAGQAIAAANVLKRQAKGDRRLHERLTAFESELRRELSQVHTALADELKGQTGALEELYETVSAVGERIPALMLLPESGVIAGLIEDLEKAAEPDDGLKPGEDMLLERLRRLERDLKSMNAADESAWRRIEDKLGHLLEAGPADAIALALNGKPSVH